MVLMLLAMAAMLLFESVPLVMNHGPVVVICPAQPRKLTCELGVSLIRSLPTDAQRTVLGMSGLAATVCVLCLVWVFARSRRKR